MKKTLTVNLGGTVFHIDEDAYQLLDKYLTNLRIHFNKEESSDEIMNDFEMRISELFNERIRLGYEVITIDQVENVIKRMGKPEELFGEDFEKETSESSSDSTSSTNQTSYKETVHKRLFRNPDDRILGGVCGGLAAYLGWDPTALRLILFVLTFFYGVTVPIYFVLWLIVPMARTATEKLQMRGESVTIENIGKTVTDGFEKVSSNVNDYINSGKPRSSIQKVGDVIVDILGVLLKVAFGLLAILTIPPLLLALFLLIVVFGALVFGGGFGILYHIAPSFHWDMFSGYSQSILVGGSLCSILLLGIPIIAGIYALLSFLFKFKPIGTKTKWALLIIWLLAFIFNIYFVARYGIPFWSDWDYLINTSSWNFSTIKLW